MAHGKTTGFLKGGERVERRKSKRSRVFWVVGAYRLKEHLRDFL